jgi:hypothetical protein
MEESTPVSSLVCMKRRMLLTMLGLGLLVLAVGGWIVQGLRFAPRALATAAVR